MTYVVDMHVLVWFLEGSSRLGMAARAALSNAASAVVISTIVLAEITFLYARHRIAIDLSNVLDYIVSAANCVVYPLGGAVIERLPTTFNIHDAIIVATALMFQDVLNERPPAITKDADITAAGLADVLW